MDMKEELVVDCENTIQSDGLEDHPLEKHSLLRLPHLATCPIFTRQQFYRGMI